MLLPRFTASISLVTTLMVFATDFVSGQNYPAKPIRIVASETGGTADTLSRLIAPGISGSLGQPVIVDNRPGGVIPGEVVSKALPDGYTLLVLSNTFWTGPLLYSVPYDVERDFAPITLALSSPNILVVNRSLPVKSVKELIALAKARPGELNYASGPTGAPNHISVELFKSMAGVNIVRIPYKGSAPAIADLIAGEVQLMINAAASTGQQIKAGRLRAIAVTSVQPSALFPGLPTVAASLPGYEAAATVGMFAPARTPAAIVNRLHQEVVRVLSSADVKERYFALGIDVVGSSPEQFAAAIKSEMARLGKVIKDAGIRGE